MKSLIGTLFCILLLLAGGCMAQTPAPTQETLQNVDHVYTQAAATIFARLTAEVSPTPVPSQTPTPTATAPLPTRTITPTYVIPSATVVYPTITYTPSQSNFTCAITDLEPEEEDSFNTNEQFDGVVELKNTGREPWEPGKVIFLYTSGTVLQKADYMLPLTKQVEGGKTIELYIDMIAPENPGVYQTTWALMRDGLYFCPVHFNVVVK